MSDYLGLTPDEEERVAHLAKAEAHLRGIAIAMENGFVMSPEATKMLLLFSARAASEWAQSIAGLGLVRYAATLKRGRGRPPKGRLSSLVVRETAQPSADRSNEKYSAEMLSTLHDRVQWQISRAAIAGDAISAREGLRREINEWLSTVEMDDATRVDRVSATTLLWEPRLSTYRTRTGKRITRKLQGKKEILDFAQLENCWPNPKVTHVNHRPSGRKEEHGNKRRTARAARKSK